MMKIEPLIGIGEDPLTRERRDNIDTGVDMIVCYEGGKRIEVGYVNRIPGSGISFTRQLSDSQRKEAIKAVEERECDGETKPRKITQAGNINAK